MQKMEVDENEKQAREVGGGAYAKSGALAKATYLTLRYPTFIFSECLLK